MQLTFNLFPGGRDKALTMSYDDGREFDVRLAGIFDKNGLKATFHLNSGRLGAPGFITGEDVKNHLAKHEISAHTVTHPYLERMPIQLTTEEILADREALEILCGYPVRGMSYPYGTYSKRLIEHYRCLGVEYSRTVAATRQFYLPQDFMEWHPTAHHNMDIAALWKSFTAANPGDRYLKVMYIWGHSYEFDGDNNWSMIEEFCAEAGGRGDVWYATNAEIMDYANAVRGLKISADKRMIQNLSLYDVWLTVDSKAVCVKSGDIYRYEQ